MSTIKAIEAEVLEALESRPDWASFIKKHPSPNRGYLVARIKHLLFLASFGPEFKSQVQTLNDIQKIWNRRQAALIKNLTSAEKKELNALEEDLINYYLPPDTLSLQKKQSP